MVSVEMNQLVDLGRGGGGGGGGGGELTTLLFCVGHTMECVCGAWERDLVEASYSFSCLDNAM